MSDHAQQTRDLAKTQFERWANTYDRSLLNHFLFRPTYYNFIEEIGLWQDNNDRQMDVLDVGCGTGTFLMLLSATNMRVNRVVGLDYAMSMCVEGAAKASSQTSIGFANGDSEYLPFANGSFDVVTCGNSFHHYPNQQGVVSEMRRILRPGGRLIISDGFRDNIVGWVVFDVIITHIEKSVYHAPWQTMRRYFERAGFSDICQRKFNFLFPSLLTIGTV